LWRRRLGVYSRIRKGRHLVKVRQWNGLNAEILFHQYNFPNNSPEYNFYRSLWYRSVLDLLPLFLENSAISLELAKVLRGCTFTMMGWKFPRRMRVAKDAIARYLLRVESGESDPMNC
jgi:hypothetical protein